MLLGGAGDVGRFGSPEKQLHFLFFLFDGGGGRRRWEDPNTGGSMKTSESQALGQAGFGLVSIQKRGFCGIPVDVLQPGLLVKVNERDDTSS